MHTGATLLGPTRRLARWLLSALVISLIGAVVVSVGVLRAPGATPTSWTAEDEQRTGVAAVPVSDPTGMIGKDQAIANALAIYDPPDSDVQLDAFLLSVTDERSAGTVNDLVDRPVWIVRYSNILGPALAPGPAADEIRPQHRYQYLDAFSGADVGAQWTR